MRILWMRCASASPAFAAAGFPSTAADIITISASFEGEKEKETTRQRAREETKRKETNPQGPKAPRETHEKDAKIIGIRAEKHARDPAKTPRTREIRTSLNERLRLGIINFFCVRVARFLYSRLSDRSEEISSPPFSSFLWKLNPLHSCKTLNLKRYFFLDNFRHVSGKDKKHWKRSSSS